MILRITNQDDRQVLSGWHRGDKLASWMDRYVSVLRQRDTPASAFPRLTEVTTDSGQLREVWAPPTPA